MEKTTKAKTIDLLFMPSPVIDQAGDDTIRAHASKKVRFNTSDNFGFSLRTEAGSAHRFR
jgi:hypothetical protein